MKEGILNFFSVFVEMPEEDSVECKKIIDNMDVDIKLKGPLQNFIKKAEKIRREKK